MRVTGIWMKKVLEILFNGEKVLESSPSGVYL
jgi:hypothetical protein